MTIAPDRPLADRPMVGCPSRRHPRGTAPVRSTGGEQPPKLADGVQLLGEYAGTGYEQAQYLARRPGGQLVQLSPLLHQVADECDGDRSMEQIAERVSRSYGKPVSPDNIRTLVDKLRPLGVLAAADGTSPAVQEPDPLLGLKLRTQLLSPPLVRRLAAVVRPVFWPPLVLAVVVALIAVDVWLFFVHGVGEGLRTTLEQPIVFLLVAAVVVVSAALHEFGHAAACAYGGAKPGGMGAGIYVVWPAFYTDVTEAYQLDKKGRLRTDLGGVYVNAMIVVATALVYAATRYEPLVLLCFLLQIQVLQQMLPFLRLDGYYVVSDLVGVPDLFRRIGPVLRSSLPFRALEPEVAELKPWVRRVVAGWVFVLVPVLALNLGYFLLSAPRIAATSWDSAMRFLGQITTAGGTTAVFAAVQLVLLLLPTVGITYTLVRVVRRGTAGAWRWSAGSAPRRAGVLVGSAAALVLLVLAWYPDGRVTPYREGERGTVQQHVGELSTAGTGSPLLRGPREAQDRLPAVPDGTSAVTAAAVQDRAAAGADSDSSPTGTADGTGTRAGTPPSAAPTQDAADGTTPGATDATADDSTTDDETPDDSTTDDSTAGASDATTDGTTDATTDAMTTDATPDATTDASTENSTAGATDETTSSDTTVDGTAPSPAG